MNHARDLKRIDIIVFTGAKKLVNHTGKRKKTCIHVPRAIALDASCMRSAACSPKI